MATRPTTLPEWASDAGAAKTPPSAAKRALGWTITEKPDHNWLNWFWNLVYQWIDHADAINQYATPEAAIAAMADGDLAYVFEDDSSDGTGIILASATTTQKAQNSDGTLSGIDSAGDLVVVGTGDMDPVGILRSSLAGADGGGSEEITYTRSATGTTRYIIALRTDGEIVVAAYGDNSTSTTGRIEAWNATTGASLWTFNWGPSDLHDVEIGPDGVYAVGEYTTVSGGTNNRQLYKLNRTTGAEIWAYQHGSGAADVLTSVRTNGRQVFVAGNASSSSTAVLSCRIRALNASNGYDANNEGLTGQDTTGLAWDGTLNANPTQGCMDIGHGRVYVGFLSVATYQMEVLGQGDGVILYQRAHTDGNFSAVSVACDQDSIHLAYFDGTATDEGWIETHDARSFAVSARVAEYSIGIPGYKSVGRVCSDGFAVFALGYQSTDIWKFSRGNVPTLVRKSATDENDRMSRWLLQPVDRRVV